MPKKMVTSEHQVKEHLISSWELLLTIKGTPYNIWNIKTMKEFVFSYLTKGKKQILRKGNSKPVSAIKVLMEWNLFLLAVVSKSSSNSSSNKE